MSDSPLCERSRRGEGTDGRRIVHQILVIVTMDTRSGCDYKGELGSISGAFLSCCPSDRFEDAFRDWLYWATTNCIDDSINTGDQRSPSFDIVVFRNNGND